jgi:hypothetical protein
MPNVYDDIVIKDVDKCNLLTIIVRRPGGTALKG